MKIKPVLYQYKSALIFGVIVLASTIPTLYTHFFSDPPQLLPSTQLPEAPKPTRDVSEEKPLASQHTMIVHIAGAVLHPGVYSIPEGTSLIAAIQQYGGGFIRASDLDKVNLAKPIKSGSRIYVPFKKGKKRRS